MNLALRAAVLVALTFVGCRTAHDVAVGSYRVATAPVRLVHPRRDNSSPATTTTTTTTTTVSPDVGNSGQRVSVESPSPSERRSVPSATRRVTQKENTESKPKPTPSSSPRPASQQLEFPTATPVDGKPGYVYSLSDPTKYVDVSGYARGSKVKDPYSGKIFLVP